MNNVIVNDPFAKVWTQESRWQLSEQQRWRRYALAWVMDEITYAGEVLETKDARGLALAAAAISNLLRPTGTDARAVAARFGISVGAKRGDRLFGRALAARFVELLQLRVRDLEKFGIAFDRALAEKKDAEECLALAESLAIMVHSIEIPRRARVLRSEAA